MNRLILSCFLTGMIINANAQNYWKKGMKEGRVIMTSKKITKNLPRKRMPNS
jgi:glucosylceramidase